MNGNGRGPKGERKFSRKAMVIIGLAVFLAADVVLVALALGPGLDEPQAEGSASQTQSTAPEDCGGLSLVEFQESTVVSLACTSAEVDNDTTLDVSGNTLWVWTGDEALFSADLGRNLD